MLNSLILQGRITKNFVNKNGNAYSSIAVQDFKGNTMFVDIACFKQTADYCFNNIKKGQMVIVDGRLSVSKYEDKTFVSCIVRDITKIGSAVVKEETVEEISDDPISVDEEETVADELFDDDRPF